MFVPGTHFYRKQIKCTTSAENPVRTTSPVFHMLTDKFSTTRLGVVFFYPERQDPSYHSSTCWHAIGQAQQHERILSRNSLFLARLGVFVFFYPYAKIYVPPDAGDPFVKPKSTRVAHPGRICPRDISEFFGFLDFFLRVGGPTPTVLGFASPTYSDFALTTA